MKKFTNFIIFFSCFFSVVASASVVSSVSLNLPNVRVGSNHLLVGIMLPASPDTYQQYTALMKNKKSYREGLFKFTTGEINGVSVVLSSPPPIGSFSLTAIDTYLMEKIYKPNMLVDPGTAGSHLPDLSMGDVVVGARVVNFSNYMTRSDGKIVPGQFSALVSDNEGYKKGNPNPEYIYADPYLVKLASKAARQVAHYTSSEILSAPLGRKPWILTYGSQGSGAAWLRNVKQIRASTKIFHEADEAGNYPIALVSTVNSIPFIEIHTISDAAINVPTKMNNYFHLCSVYAQRRSNKIVFAMLELLSSGSVSLHGRFIGGFSDPWPRGTFTQATNPPGYIVSWTDKYGVFRG